MWCDDDVKPLLSLSEGNMNVLNVTAIHWHSYHQDWSQEPLGFIHWGPVTICMNCRANQSNSCRGISSWNKFVHQIKTECHQYPPASMPENYTLVSASGLWWCHFFKWSQSALSCLKSSSWSYEWHRLYLCKEQMWLNSWSASILFGSKI